MKYFFSPAFSGRYLALLREGEGYRPVATSYPLSVGFADTSPKGRGGRFVTRPL
ncbi:MAG: hypothetical protein IKI51_03695 [Clostridia bacterium]|nr:hypothetical protein [Clostridia bacterium]